MKRTNTLLTAALVLLLAATANAQVVVETNAQKVDPTVRTLAGITIGTEYGYGLAVRYGNEKYALELGGGFSPLYTFWTEDFNDPTRDNDLRFTVFNNVIAAAKVDMLIKNSPNRRVGLKIGVEYSTIRSYGGGIALSMQVHKEPYIFVNAGYSYYPEGTAKIRAELEHKTDYNIEHSDHDDLLDNSSIVLSVNFFLWP